MKEKDKLKEFITSNREEFDFETPPSMDFSELKNKKLDSNKAKQTKVIPLKTVINIAAAITIFIAIGGFIYYQTSISKQTETIIVEQSPSNKSAEFSISTVSTEMAEVESYYIQQVNTRQQQIIDAGFSEDIKEELELLDEEFNNLKAEIGNGVDDQLILEEMIENYQLKLNLLEKVLNNINALENKPSKKEENDASYTIYY